MLFQLTDLEHHTVKTWDNMHDIPRWDQNTFSRALKDHRNYHGGEVIINGNLVYSVIEPK